MDLLRGSDAGELSRNSIEGHLVISVSLVAMNTGPIGGSISYDVNAREVKCKNKG